MSCLVEVCAQECFSSYYFIFTDNKPEEYKSTKIARRGKNITNKITTIALRSYMLAIAIDGRLATAVNNRNRGSPS